MRQRQRLRTSSDTMPVNVKNKYTPSSTPPAASSQDVSLERKPHRHREVIKSTYASYRSGGVVGGGGNQGGPSR